MMKSSVRLLDDFAQTLGIAVRTETQALETREELLFLGNESSLLPEDLSDAGFEATPGAKRPVFQARH